MRKPVYIMVACALNRVIGRQGGLPWKIPEDLKYYRDKVRGGILIHGRRVYDELGRAMKGCTTIVLTRDRTRTFADAEAAPDLDTALARAQAMEHPGPVWILGGQAVYEEALARADRLYLTLVQVEVEGDTYFPAWDPPFSKVVSRRDSADGNFRYSFLVLERG